MLFWTKRVPNICKKVVTLFRRLSVPMAYKKPPLKKPELPEKTVERPEVALAAITSYRKQKEVNDFIVFVLDALERNSKWLNTVVDRQPNFRCALLVGAGPNRYQIQEIIYPVGENNIKLEVEMKESEDHDKVAFAALVKMNNIELDNLLKYITRLGDNSMLREDLLKGRAMGISFAVLKPFAEKQYRITERIVIGSSMKCALPPKCPVAMKKRRRDEKLLTGPPKKSRKVT